MKSIYLNEREIKNILDFMNSFTTDPTRISSVVSAVEIVVEGDNGIGNTTIAKLHDIKLNGHTVIVSKVISDESDW
jgi:hypothetical protein